MVIKRSIGGYVFCVGMVLTLAGTAVGVVTFDLSPAVSNVLIFFGLVISCLFAYATYLCNPPLKLYADHFEIKSPRMTKSFLWSDVERFELKLISTGDSGPLHVVAFFLTPEAERLFLAAHPRSKHFSLTAPAENFHSLPQMLAVPPAELLQLMRNYGTNARAH